MKRWILDQLIARDIVNARVLLAMEQVPRERFVPPEYQDYAYDDRPLPIGYGQTISQPFIVAYMTSLLDPQESERILEVGTGSGYQAAILSGLCKEVYTIEVVLPFFERAGALLKDLGYGNVHVRCDDGYAGWPEKSPFAGIILTAAPKKIPEALFSQLGEGGRIVGPVGTRWEQVIVRYVKHGNKLVKEEFIPVQFVPMVSGFKGTT